MNRVIISNSPEETWGLAAELVRKLPCPMVIALHGELGSGKTCFVQGMARAMDVNQPVTSPTFKIVNEYRGSRPLYHIDLYRLRGSDDARAIGIDDYIEGDGIVAIEWAERIADLLPPETVRVRFETTDQADQRRITMDTPG